MSAEQCIRCLHNALADTPLTASAGAQTLYRMKAATVGCVLFVLLALVQPFDARHLKDGMYTFWSCCRFRVLWQLWQLWKHQYTLALSDATGCNPVNVANGCGTFVYQGSRTTVSLQMRRCNRATPNGNSCSHQRPLLLPVLIALLQQPQQLPTARLPPLPLRHLRVSLLATRAYRLRERVE